MAREVDVSGLADLERALGGLSVSAQKGVLRRIGCKALEPFDASWREKAPELSGKLKQSGGVGSKLTRSQRQQHERQNAIEVFAGPGPDPEAVQQEFGNHQHPAQPFVRPAWDETQDAALEIVKADLGGEILKAAARQARKAARAAAKG